MKRATKTELKKPFKKPRNIAIKIECTLPDEMEPMPLEDVKTYLSCFLKFGLRNPAHGDMRTDIQALAQSQNSYVTDSMVVLAARQLGRENAFDEMWNPITANIAPPKVDSQIVDQVMSRLNETVNFLKDIGFTEVGDENGVAVIKFNELFYDQLANEIQKQQFQEYHDTMAQVQELSWGNHVKRMLALQAQDDLEEQQ